MCRCHLNVPYVRHQVWPGLATVEESYPIRRFKTLVNQLYKEVYKLAQEGPGEPPCGDCTSSCCTYFHESIVVTEEDVERIAAAGHSKESFRKGNVTKPGYYGYVHSPDGNCRFFDPSTQRCGIHEIKPQVCREYSAHDCGMYFTAPMELVKLRRSKSS